MGWTGDRMVTEWHKPQTTEWISVASHQFAAGVIIDSNMVVVESYFEIIITH